MGKRPECYSLFYCVILQNHVNPLMLERVRLALQHLTDVVLVSAFGVCMLPVHPPVSCRPFVSLFSIALSEPEGLQIQLLFPFV